MLDNAEIPQVPFADEVIQNIAEVARAGMYQCVHDNRQGQMDYVASGGTHIGTLNVGQMPIRFMYPVYVWEKFSPWQERVMLAIRQRVPLLYYFLFQYFAYKTVEAELVETMKVCARFEKRMLEREERKKEKAKERMRKYRVDSRISAISPAKNR